MTEQKFNELNKANMTKEEKIKQIAAIDKQIGNLTLFQGIVSSLGSLGGLYYANKTGGGALRYIGFFLLGGFLIGGITGMGIYTKKQGLTDEKKRIDSL